MLLIITLFIVSLIYWFVNDNFKSNRPPDFPLIGNLVQLSQWSKKEPHTQVMLQQFSKKYGPVASFKFGMLEQIVIDDPALIREVLSADEWGQRPVNEYFLERSFGKQLGILWSRGETNKELRRFSLRTLRDFGFGKQKSQDAVMEEELKELMSRLDSKLEKEGNTICMQQFFNISVLNIIWSMVAGLRFSHTDPEFSQLVGQINQTTKLISPLGNIMIGFPFLRHILPYLTGCGKVRRETIQQLHNSFMNILKERRALGQYKEDQRDFIDVFISEIDKHADTKLSYIYADAQFIITLLNFFLAGSETTSNTLEYSILLMILNPEVQKKVREEIERVIGNDKMPNYADKQEMPYTEATVLEILRVSSVVPLIVRCPLEDTIVGSYKIPKETYTILNTYSAHCNPKIWENPEAFDPQNFLKDEKVVNGEKLIPFGLGKRYCLGEVLARATLFTYFVTMVQNYTFELPENYPKPSLKGLPGITLSPQKYHAVIHRRD